MTVLVVALVAVALLVSGLAAGALMRSYLLQRVDQQLLEVASSPLLRSQDPAVAGSMRLGGTMSGPAPGQQPPLPSNYYVRFAAVDGTVLGTTTSAFSRAVPALPQLTREQAQDLGGEPFTVQSEGDGPQWRAVAFPTPTGVTTVSQDISAVDRTADRLDWLLVGIGLIVLLLVAAAAWWLVRRSLAPLMAVEEAATAIAAGDLSRRVPDQDPRSEVGHMSAALNSMLGQLEGAWAAREGALAEARASEARMRAFVSDASHELRTPLTAVSGYAQLYRQGAVAPDDVPATFDRIEGEADRMAALVDDLLLLARLDQRRPLERTPIDVLGLAAADIAAAQAGHPARDITLVGPQTAPGSRRESSAQGTAADGAAAQDTAADAADARNGAVVLGDRARLSQVVRNLLANALRYSQGRIDVRVTTRAGRVRVEVVDHGPGVPDSEKGRIFDRFYRADQARARRDGGSGLGLSISAAIAAAHDGTVTVSDTPGGGATFTLELPAFEAPSNDLSPSRART